MAGDAAAELIGLLRALPPQLASLAQTDEDPAAGVRLPVPEDPLWAVEAVQAGMNWVLFEVWDPPGALAGRRTTLATGPADTLVEEIAREFTRLQLRRRNAACGTPTGRDGRRSSP